MEDIRARVNLRRIAKDDKDRIRDILINVGNFSEAEIKVALSLIDLYFGGDEDYNFVVATYENQVIGYACYGLNPMARGTWDIYWMAISKEYQRKKIASYLIESIEDDIRKRGGRLILIETSSKRSYDGTRAFYEKMGYRMVSRIEKFYSEMDDKLIYGKYLKQDILRD